MLFWQYRKQEIYGGLSYGGKMGKTASASQIRFAKYFRGNCGHGGNRAGIGPRV